MKRTFWFILLGSILSGCWPDVPSLQQLQLPLQLNPQFLPQPPVRLPLKPQPRPQRRPDSSRSMAVS
jgi:hypothetical protein